MVMNSEGATNKIPTGMLCSSLTYKVPGYLKVVFFELKILSSLLYCFWGL